MTVRSLILIFFVVVLVQDQVGKESGADSKQLILVLLQEHGPLIKAVLSTSLTMENGRRFQGG